MESPVSVEVSNRAKPVILLKFQGEYSEDMGSIGKPQQGWATRAVRAGRGIMGIGLFLLALAAGSAVHSWAGTRGLVRAQATVVENIAAFAPGGGVTYTPRIRFRKENGELLELTSGPASSDADFAPGDVVPVLHPKGNPHAVVIATVYRLYFWAIWLATVGTVFFDVGLVARRWAIS